MLGPSCVAHSPTVIYTYGLTSKIEVRQRQEDTRRETADSRQTERGIMRDRKRQTEIEKDRDRSGDKNKEKQRDNDSKRET